jgi:NADH-quinone oxidoreductase subunit J
MSMMYFFIISLTITCTIVVISARNPVHSILALIFVVLNLAFLLICLEAGFLGLIYIAVYLGAVTVIYLFVVMMLSLKSSKFAQEISHSFPLGSFVGLMFLFFLFSIISLNSGVTEMGYMFYNPVIDWFSLVYNFYDIQLLGSLLYTQFAPFLLIIGIILLIAMVGAVILTKTNNLEKRQDFIDQQISRNYKRAVFLVNGKSNRRERK